MALDCRAQDFTRIKLEALSEKVLAHVVHVNVFEDVCAKYAQMFLGLMIIGACITSQPPARPRLYIARLPPSTGNSAGGGRARLGHESLAARD